MLVCVRCLVSDWWSYRRLLVLCWWCVMCVCLCVHCVGCVLVNSCCWSLSFSLRLLLLLVLCMWYALCVFVRCCVLWCAVCC